MMPPPLLGVDGGGSQTTAWLADAEGRVLGRGKAGPSNIKSIGSESSWQALNQAIREAFADLGAKPGPVDVACLGLAGFDRPVDRALLQDWAANGRWSRRLVLVNDGELVLAAGTPHGWGVGLIAGTGSIAVGRWPDGRTARAGGWGYLFGDEGSAYAVAIAGLRWVAHRADGRLAEVSGDVLSRRLCQALGINDPSELITVVYAPDFDRTRIAALAPVVVEAAEEDPFLAENILKPAAVDLAELVLTVARRLGWREWNEQRRMPLALAGNFLLATPVVYDGVVAAVEEMGLPVQVKAVPDPVAGAVLLARKALSE